MRFFRADESPPVAPETSDSPVVETQNRDTYAPPPSLTAAPPAPLETIAPFDSAVIEDDFVRISEPFLLGDKSAMSPDVAVDTDGVAWVVWAEASPQQICVRKFHPDGAGLKHTASLQSGIEFQPCITNLAHGSLRVFWIAFRDEAWQLVTRSFRGDNFGSESIVATNAGGIFHPRAAIDASGNCWVVCEKVDGANTTIAVYRQSKDAWVEEKLETLGGDCHRPDVCLGPDDLLWVAYDSYGSSQEEPDSVSFNGSFKGSGQASDRGSYRNYRIAIQSIPSSEPPRRSTAENDDAGASEMSVRGIRPIIVADDGYQNVHASLANDGSGNLWIAFASNRNDARRDPAWLTKWSYLYRFDGTNLDEPTGHRPDVDLYNEHAFQGWEYPAVAAGPGGNALLVGQSAHSILVQAYSGKMWSAAQTVVERKWGSWKPRCRVAGSETMFLVSMGLGGAQIQRIKWIGSDTETAASVVVPVGQRLPAQPNPETNIGVRIRRPSIEATDGTKYNVYFGDLHAHSSHSDAVGDVDELYNRYRDTYGYDFAALTDHDYVDGIKLAEGELKLIWNHADRASADDDFLAWYGYEWTSPAIAVHAAEGEAVGEGHRHVLYPDASGSFVRYGDEANTGRQLLKELNGVRALVIPHHSSWSGTDWDAHDDQLQRVVEIVSVHGRFEYSGNQPIGYRRDHIHSDKFVRDALDRGYKLGFVGGSDSHGLRWHATELDGRAAHIEDGTRVGWKEDAYRAGMTAILADELTRESLFQAVYNRRCYATSGAPILVDFRVNGRIMGSEIALAAPAKSPWQGPRISIRVEGTAPIRSIEVIRSGHAFGGLQMQPGEGIRSTTFEMEDTIIVPGESHYYYVRVLQEDGEMAWSSPIWVR